MQTKIKKRETFYLSGYDPRGVRYYYNLYKKESKEQEKISGLKIEVGSRQKRDTHIYSWEIHSHREKQKSTTYTTYHFLGYDDLIRERWDKSSLGILRDMWFYIKTYIFTGVLFSLSKASPKQFSPLIFPVAYLFLAMAISLFMSITIFKWLVMFMPLSVGLLTVLGLFFSLMQLLIRLGEKTTAFWLLRIYVFSGKYVLEERKSLDERIDYFAQYIAKHINTMEKNGIDEVLIVAHSVGTILLIPIVAKALEKSNVSLKKMQSVSILTLGECIPLVSFLEEAKVFKTQMQSILAYKNFTWFDYTAPVDGACFPLVDYYQHAGIAKSESQGPIYLSPRFHLLYEKENYAILKRKKFLLHFLYIMSTDTAGVYDFFKMTAGEQHLKDYLK